MKLLWIQALVLSSSLNVLGMDEAPQFSQMHEGMPQNSQLKHHQGIETAAAIVIEYIKVGLKNYTGGATLPRPSENDNLCQIYLDLANQFVLAGTKPEDVLRVWTDLAQLFLGLSKMALKTEAQQQEYQILKEELETHKEKNYIWYTLYMQALSQLITNQKKRGLIIVANTRFDSYQIALNEHQHNDQPAWLSHEGRLEACRTIGSEWTRHVASPLALAGLFPEIVFLWCPFDLFPADFIITQPSHLWFIGFTLADVSADGATIPPAFFSFHDMQHFVIRLWFLSGGDFISFVKSAGDFSSVKLYWDYVREGRMIWYDCENMFRDMIMRMPQKNKSDEDIMLEFLIFWLTHEGINSLMQRLTAIFCGEEDTGLADFFYEDTSSLLDPRYYFSLLPQSMQSKKSHPGLFKEDLRHYIHLLYQKIEQPVSMIKKKHDFNAGYLLLQLTDSALFINFDYLPYNAKKDRNFQDKIMIDQYGFQREVYKALKKRKRQMGPEILGVCYDFRGSPFYTEEDIPVFQKAIFDIDEHSLGNGVGLVMSLCAHKTKKMQKTLKLYRLAAMNGHKEALNFLATMYKEGKGVEKDIPKAIELYKMAIEKGGVRGIGHLGEIYHNGDESIRDYKKAAEFYEMAIDRGGSVGAMINLATLYCRGHGVEQDYKKALVLLHQARENSGFAYAQIAVYYIKGWGVEVDFLKAVELMDQAFEKGAEMAKEFFSRMDFNASEIKGFKYYDVGDFSKSFVLLNQVAKLGNEKAQGILEELHQCMNNMILG